MPLQQFNAYYKRTCSVLAILVMIFAWTTGAYAAGISGHAEEPGDSTVIVVNTDSIDLPTITLDEAVVTATRASVVTRHDTIEYNAASFKTAANANVENLLKKLPGVEVSADGSITVAGKTVKKILVDGKEFFSDDPTVASRNLPSDIVDKVQVTERKSDAARLTGIDDGEEETVINLTVKKGMNNGWFGNVSAGYGTDNRYEAGLNINYFREGNQFSIIGGTNNTNDMGFGDTGRGRFRDFGGSNGINTTRQLGFNFNIGREDIIRFGGNVFYANTDRRSISKSHTQYLFPDSVSSMRNGSDSRDIGHSVRADFRVLWNINTYNTLEFTPRFSLNYRKSELADTSVLRSGGDTGFRVNSNDSRRFNRGMSYQVSGQLIFNHRFQSREGRSFSAMVDYDFSDTKEHGTSWSRIEYYLKKDDHIPCCL